MLEKLKELLNPKNQKKTSTGLIVLLFAGAIVLLLSNFFLPENNNNGIISGEENNNPTKNYESELTEDDYVISVESRLKEILKKIQGVGEVHVMITFEDTAEKVPVFNTTQTVEKTDEKDAQGGTREVTREDLSQQIAYENGSDSLMILKETNPKVRGVIVVAEGAENIEIKEKLYSAVKTVLGITGNRVEIYPSN